MNIEPVKKEPNRFGDLITTKGDSPPFPKRNLDIPTTEGIPDLIEVDHLLILKVLTNFSTHLSSRGVDVDSLTPFVTQFQKGLCRYYQHDVFLSFGSNLLMSLWSRSQVFLQIKGRKFEVLVGPRTYHYRQTR